MRPRIRTIKPEALKHEGLWDLEQESGLPIFRAFVGLWTVADRRGRFEWKPRTLKSDVVPHWEGDFSRVLDALTTRGFLVRYACSGREYGWIPSFELHQVVNNREEESKLPVPPVSGCVTNEYHTDIDALSTRAPRVEHACPTPTLPCTSGTERNGTERNGTEREIPRVTDATKPTRSHEEQINLNSEQKDASKPTNWPTPPQNPLQSLESSLTVPVQERAALLLAGWHQAQWCQPHRWPEAIAALERFATALSWTRPRLVKPDHAKRAVELLAAFTEVELETAAKLAKNNKWLSEPGKGTACLTVDVVASLLSSERKGGQKTPEEVQKMLADEEYNRQRRSYGYGDFVEPDK